MPVPGKNLTPGVSSTWKAPDSKGETITMIGRDDLILAIDLGTSAAKVIVFDLAGRVIASDERATLLRHPRPTWIESNAETWWETVGAGIRAILDHPHVCADAIRAVGVCGFQHTLV